MEKDNTHLNPSSTLNFNLHEISTKIKELLDKGESVKMKNKDKFKLTLEDTRDLVSENLEFLEKMKNDQNYQKIMLELKQTISDLESKLNKLSLIKFCRDKAEKYLAQVREKLYNINLVIISLLGTKKEVIPEVKEDNTGLIDEISKLNKKIKEMESNMNKKEAVSPVVQEKKVIVEKQMNKDETLLLEGLQAYLGLNNRVDFKLAFEKLSQSSHLGNSSAKVLLGRMYEKGDYVDKSFSKAFEFVREASSSGNSQASFIIGNFAENEVYILDENQKYDSPSEIAMEYYMKSSEEGNSEATTKLGIAFENGLLGQFLDNKTAVEYYKKAIEMDENPEALNCIGSIYYKGYVMKQNFPLAFESFQRAAKLGNLDAINNLGLCYEYGKGVEKNLEKAMIHYKQASDKLHPMALANQAILLVKLNTEQRKKDYKKAFKLLQLSIYLEEDEHASTSGNKDAFYYLGYLYENGFGVNTDPFLAFKNYKRAMKLGHVNAKTKVGLVMFNGLEGVIKKDEEGGIKLLNEAANMDDPEALNYLGLIYEKGSRYLMRSHEKCVECLKKSEALGYQNASINLALLTKTSPIYNSNLKDSASTGPNLSAIDSVSKNDALIEKMQKLSKKGNILANTVIDVISNRDRDDKSMAKTIKLSPREIEKELVNFDQ